MWTFSPDSGESVDDFKREGGRIVSVRKTRAGSSVEDRWMVQGQGQCYHHSVIIST